MFSVFQTFFLKHYRMHLFKRCLDRSKDFLVKVFFRCYPLHFLTCMENLAGRKCDKVRFLVIFLVVKLLICKSFCLFVGFILKRPLSTTVSIRFLFDNICDYLNRMGSLMVRNCLNYNFHWKFRLSKSLSSQSARIFVRINHLLLTNEWENYSRCAWLTLCFRNKRVMKESGKRFLKIVSGRL